MVTIISDLSSRTPIRLITPSINNFILLLTGSIQGTKNKVNDFLSSFEQYSWLWNKRADEDLKLFNKGNPQLEDFEEKLKELQSTCDPIIKKVYEAHGGQGQGGAGGEDEEEEFEEDL